MLDLENIINDFVKLGKAFHLSEKESGLGTADARSNLPEAVDKSFLSNPWFIPSFVNFAFSAWADALQEEKIRKWLSGYDLKFKKKNEILTAGLIMAGNIPMVGFHDLLCVLATGNRALIKLSSSDNVLIPAVLDALFSINPVYRDLILFTDGPMKGFDAIIATGSNNSSRYFDYYFGKYPHIIRKNRNSAAVLTGFETDRDLENLADDIFMYFGLGCRNVSKLYIPAGYDVEKLFPHFGKYAFLADHHKYRNNYDYQKSILLINRIPHHDNGFLLVKKAESPISPISVIHTEEYNSPWTLEQHLADMKDQIQCIVAGNLDSASTIKPGRSQFPELWDYADGMDTMEFLTNL